MRHTSVMNEVEQIHLAAELISLGARLQLLEQETTLSRERLVKLYKFIAERRRTRMIEEEVCFLFVFMRASERVIEFACACACV